MLNEYANGCVLVSYTILLMVVPSGVCLVVCISNERIKFVFIKVANKNSGPNFGRCHCCVRHLLSSSLLSLDSFFVVSFLFSVTAFSLVIVLSGKKSESR